VATICAASVGCMRIAQPAPSRQFPAPAARGPAPRLPARRSEYRLPRLRALTCAIAEALQGARRSKCRTETERTRQNAQPWRAGRRWGFLPGLLAT
jgi:hypothetical protein